MSDQPVLPAYGRSSLAELMPSIAAHLGVRGFSDDPIGLPPSRRYVVCMVDGLGWHVLASALRHAPCFADLFGDARRLTTGVPSTTSTSLSCLGTGLVPGRHGIVGYAFREPASGRVLNALTWENGPDPLVFQPRPTMFETLSDAGVATSSVSPARFEASGLTLASQRGADFVPVLDEADLDARVALTVEASRRGSSSVVYLYERMLDHTGHGQGCGSSAWLQTLGRIDGFVEKLLDALDPDTCLLVTGDHGMVDVPEASRVYFEDHPVLTSGVDLLAGEGRLRQLYTARPTDVAARWADLLGERAWVTTRDEAIDAGWFGAVGDDVRERIGDVLVAMRGDGALMSRALERELSLVGMHGSLTPAEMYVPLLAEFGRGDG